MEETKNESPRLSSLAPGTAARASSKTLSGTKMLGKTSCLDLTGCPSVYLPVPRPPTRPLPMRSLDRSCSDQRTVSSPYSQSVLDTDIQLVHVPGVTNKAYVSRQTLLAEIASSLGLSIYSDGIVNESLTDIRAWVEIDTPLSGTQWLASKVKFYGESATNIYTAMESAASTAIEHLVKEKKICVDDTNYTQTVFLRARLQAATSFQDIYREDEGVASRYIASLKECNQKLLRQIQKLCAHHAGFLPAMVMDSVDQIEKQESNITVRYTGQVPPTTEVEKSAMELACIASTKSTAGLYLTAQGHD